MGDPVLQVRGLTTKLRSAKGDVPIVDGLSFDLHAGKTLALLGESGCGKSMTALSLLRVLPQPPMLPSEGEVLFHGRNILDLSERAMRKIRGQGISMIFQDPSSALNPVYPILDQFFEVLSLHLGIHGEEAYQRSVQALREVGIPAPEQRLREYPHQLSGGMKQRMMIAMALLCEPEVLIADEPTTALDVTIQAQVLDILRELQRRRGTAILLITHDMGVVAEMADEVIVMYASRAVEHGPVETLFDHMAHPYTRALFNSLPHRSQVGERLPAIPGSVPPAHAYPHGCRFHPRCPHAMDRCRSGTVPTCKVGKGHEAMCWLHAKKEVLS
ncbi:MAG: ABC transporter ATP-binding protein [Chlamydiia bacterium]|nr:ABC transporter ATP-binding protein [Chlamydiia bacterium]